MKKSIVAFAVLFSSGFYSIAQSADEVISKHITAMGGEKALSQIKTLKMSGSINAQGMEFPTSQTMVNKQGMRMDFSVMGMDCYVIVTQKEGWMYIPVQPGMDKVTAMPEEQLKQAQSKLNIQNMWLTDRSAIAKAELDGKDTINSIPCLRLKITDKEGFEQIAYFDESTYYLIRTELNVKAGEDSKDISVTFSNFEKQPDGIVIPMKRSDPMMGGEVVYKEGRHEVKHAIPTWQKSIDILGFEHKTNFEDGLKDMWEWAQKQPKRNQFVWDTYELDNGIYSFWKK
jgi:outer membrane lipoprotein-sorting protein